jgi:hypothetical protein
MRRPFPVGLLVLPFLSALAACAAPSEPVPATQRVEILRGTSLSVAHSSADPQSRTSIRYDVPPGLHVLEFRAGNSASWVEGLRFSFTGRAQVFHVRRIVSSCNGVDIQFGNANLHDATRFFTDNPVTTDVNVFYISVENSADATVPLQVTARFGTSSTSSPCGL